MKLREKLKALKAAQAEYHAKADKLTPPQIAAESIKFQKMQQEISATVSEGAKDCPDCGNPPHGIFHDGTPNPFEIGCRVCSNHRVRGALPEDAVEDWNAGNYLPAKPPGTVTMTHRAVTGEIKSEVTAIPITPKS
jgi:hypothetical protein